ncbi:MAG: ankyrin repeat domain-containing protein [Lentisphaeria bacterium]|nr:ankyrin repeat domain-containing protein [Lentisphaeria bacterium]MBR7143340.1 ankyrin repeat domain-containing protein [Lentisphaeria bacterium]
MKKLIFLLLCSCFLLPVPQVAAHGDPGAVLLALGMRKALETFAKKFELATATGKTLTVYFRDGVDTPKDTLYIEESGKYSAVEIPELPIGLNMDTSGRKFLLFDLFPVNKEVESAAIFTGKNWYKMELIDFPRDMVTLNLYDGEEESIAFERFFNVQFQSAARADWLKTWNLRYQIKMPNFPLKNEVGNLEHSLEVKTAKDIMPFWRDTVKVAKGLAGELRNYRVTPEALKKIPVAKIEDWENSAGTPEAELYKLAATSNTAQVEKLLKSGVNVNAASPGGRTALMNAAWHGNIPMLKLLLAHGANPDAVNFNGETALFYAVYGESQAALELLLQRTSPYQVNRFGENLLMIAVSKNSALSNWLLNFEKGHLKTVPSRYQTQKNHAGETADDYKVKFIPLSKTESKTDQ